MFSKVLKRIGTQICFTFVLGVYLSSPEHVLAATIEGMVVRVSDGDTITLIDSNQRKYRVRFLGIDAPEKNQKYGQICGRSLKSKLEGNNVVVEYRNKDRYGRILGTVFFDGHNINLEQISEGCAWFYRYYSGNVSWKWRDAYKDAENKARSNRNGLWKDSHPTPPWDFRKGR